MAKIQSLTILLALILGISATLWGFSQMSWPSASLFAWDSLRRYATFLVVGIVVIGALSVWLKINRLLTCGILACVISILTGTFWPLLVTIWFGFASYMLGVAILTGLKIDKNKLPNITTALLGAGAYGTAVGLLAHFPINYPGLYGLALAAPIVLGWRSILREYRVQQAIGSWGSYLHQPPESKWHDLAISLVALVHFSVALMPEVGHDALAMHLFIPGHLATRHEWGYDVNTYVWAVMPMMGDWLFSIGYMLAGEPAARLINVGFIFVMSWLVRDLVMWAGGSAVGARWAILIFLTAPLTFTESSSLFIESVWATFIVAGSLSIFKLLQRNNDQSVHLPVAGFLLGGALAAKAVTFTILPVLLLLLVSCYRTWAQRKLMRVIALSLVLFIVVGGIPYATAWYLTGNPVFPFFNQIFKSPFWPAIAFEAPTAFGKGLTWDVIYQATFHTLKFLESKPGVPGAPGFQWLLLFFPALLTLLISRQHRGVVLLVVAGASIALTFQALTYLRYIFPAFAWAAAGIGVALSVIHIDTAFTKRALLFIGWAVVLLNLVFFKSGTPYGDLSLQPLLSQSGRESYLNNRLPIRNAVELVNQLNVERTPVAVFSAPLAAGLNSDGLYPNWYNYQFQAKVRKATTPAHVAQLLMDKNVDYIILDSNWSSAGKRKIIEDVTEKIREQGSITVRKLKPHYQIPTELLKIPDLTSYDKRLSPLDTYVQQPDMITSQYSLPTSKWVSIVAGRST